MPTGQNSKLSAANLRIVLILSMVLLIVAAAVGFWFVRGQLDAFAIKVHDDNHKADVSSNDIAKLKTLEQDLADDVVAVKRTKNIVADATGHLYQDQIVDDITKYATSAGVAITGFTFNESEDPAVAAAAPTTTSGAPLPAGLKTTSAVVAIESPVDYTALMNFIHSIETNLTKMQLAGVSIGKQSGSNTEVTVSPLTIEVYTR